MATNAAALCFHCGEPLRRSTLLATIDGREQAVCCAGCRAAAEWIVETGLQDFYRFRSGLSNRPQVDPNPAQDRWSAYSRDDVAARFVRTANEICSVALIVDGLRCSACSWLIDRALRNVEGVVDVQVSTATARARIEWRAREGILPEILRRLASLGFDPHPVDRANAARLQQDERRTALKRLAVASFGMMQVMMFAVADYSAAIAGQAVEPEFERYFRLVSLLITTPVLFYAGAPFFASAWRSLRLRTIGVDVPVSAALLLAFGASAWNSLRDQGAVYFDSVSMFIFFLTVGRFVEMSLRHRTNGATDALALHLPAIAHKVVAGETIDVATATLLPGEVVSVCAGEVVPVDGVLIAGFAHMDESLLTGEAKLVLKTCGENVIGGAINTRSAILIRVSARPEQTVMAHIVSLLQRAQLQKTSGARVTDAASALFGRYVLLGALIVCASWLAVDPSQAFSATLAVLVVACPCAFAIATPATIAAAVARFARFGVLVVRVDAVEALAKVNRCVFDKTGTLTAGKMRIAHVATFDGRSKNDALEIATALERCTDHPIANAFAELRTGKAATDAHVEPGRGIEGKVDSHRYRIGSLEYVAELANERFDIGDSTGNAHTIVALGDTNRVLAIFTLADTLRDGSAEVASRLRSIGVESEILSGDAADSVASFARLCGIERFAARRLPQEKLDHVRSLEKGGDSVLAVGDGINDAPILGAAGVAVAMGRGAALAHAGADMILINERLDVLPEAIATARRTMRIVKQNLFWAGAYNLAAVPLAALGYVSPLLAAVGMSLSSIAVVLNAMRLAPRRLVRKSGRQDEAADVATVQSAWRTGESL